MASEEKAKSLDELNEQLGKYKTLTLEEKKKLMVSVREAINEDRKEFNRRIKEANCDLSKLNLILGATRAGKSTLFNFINGLPMIAKTVGERLVIDVDESKVCGDYAKIGHTYVSETTIPNFAKSATSEWTFVDCAGEFDTKSTLQSIINSYFKVDLAEKAKEVRLTLVVPESNITPSGSGYFRQVLNEIGKFISDWKAFENSHSVSLVVTQVKPGIQKEHFIKELGEMVCQVKDLGVFANVLNDVCKRAAVGIFNAPIEVNTIKQQQLKISQTLKSMNVPENVIKISCDLLSEEEIQTGKLAAVSVEPYNPPNTAKDIVAAIESGTKPLIKTDNQELFSMSVQPRVQSVIEVIVDDLTESLNDKISELMLHKVEDKVIELLCSFDMVNFDDYIQSVEKSECIKDVFDNLGLGEDNEINNVVKDLEDFRRLSCAATDTFKYLKLRLKSEILRMKDAYSKDADIVKVEHQREDEILEIVGINVKSSCIMSHVKTKTKYIRVVSFYCMTFDCNMEGLASVSMSIVSNAWNINGTRIIDISGEDSKDANEAGKASGHFYGFVNHVFGDGEITIKANGGKGAEGAKGAKGDPITSRASDARFPKERPSEPNRSPDVDKWQWFTGYKIWFIELKDYGIGKAGNKGHKGGKGGDSGSRGNVSISHPQGKTLERVHICSKDGAVGSGGEGGEGGQGEENGRIARASYVRHHNAIDWNDDGLSPTCTGYGPNGPKGDKGDDGQVNVMQADSNCDLSHSVKVAREKVKQFQELAIIGRLCGKLIEMLDAANL